MNEPDKINIRIGGSVSGAVVAGHGNVVNWTQVRAAGPVTQNDLATLHAEFIHLRETLTTQGGDQAALAQQKLDELEEAVNEREPDLAVMEATRNWFARKLPAFAGAINKLILNPVVTRLVAAAGDTLAAEFTRRFG